MRAIACVVLSLGLAARLHAAEADADALAKGALTALKDLLGVLEGIKDKDTATASKAKLEIAAKAVAVAVKKLEDMPDLTDEQDAALEAKYAKTIEDLNAQVGAQRKRLAELDGVGDIVGPLLEQAKPRPPDAVPKKAVEK